MKRSYTRRRKSGFTLVEVLMVMTISVIVFSMAGATLSRCFSFWRDSVGRWQLSQQARQTRARLLHNAMLNGGGLLSVSTLSIESDRLDYKLLDDAETYHLHAGSATATSNHPYFKSDTDPKEFWMVRTANKSADNTPPVYMSRFTPTLTSNDILTITYTLHHEIGERSYEQPQIIRAYLVNR